MSSQYAELRPTSGWDRFGSLGHPGKFQRVSRLAFVTAATSLTGGQPNVARCLAVSWAGTIYVHCRGLLPLREIWQVQNSLYVQVLHSPILAALLHGTRVVGVSQTLLHGTRNELRNDRRVHHLGLHSAGRPSRWASSHIPVLFILSLLRHYVFSAWKFG